MNRSRDTDARQPGLGVEQDPRLADATNEIKACFGPSGQFTGKFQHDLDGLKETIRNQERAVRMNAPSYQDNDGRHTPVGHKPSHSLILDDPRAVNLPPEEIEKLPAFRAIQAELNQQGLAISPRVTQVYETSRLGPREDIGAHRMSLAIHRNGDAELRDPPAKPVAPDPDTREVVSKLREKMTAPKPGLFQKLFKK